MPEDVTPREVASDTNGLSGADAKQHVALERTREGKRKRVARKRRVGVATPKRVDQALRTRQALTLRMAGVSYAEIARQLGWASGSTARVAIVKAMERLQQEPAEELKKVQYERYNHLLMQVWPQVNLGDIAAINTALRIMSEMNVLMGVQNAELNVRHEVTGAVLVVEGNEDDYIAALRKARGELPAIEAVAHDHV